MFLSRVNSILQKLEDAEINLQEALVTLRKESDYSQLIKEVRSAMDIFKNDGDYSGLRERVVKEFFVKLKGVFQAIEEAEGSIFF